MNSSIISDLCWISQNLNSNKLLNNYLKNMNQLMMKVLNLSCSQAPAKIYELQFSPCALKFGEIIVHLYKMLGIIWGGTATILFPK